MTNEFNPQSLFQLGQQAAQYASESIYFKMNAGIHQIRICPAWKNDGNVTMLCVNHNEYKNKEGFMRMPLCYKYAFSTQEIAMKLKDKGVLKQEDLVMYGKMGCVFCKISDFITTTQGKKANRVFARPSYKWNIVSRSAGDGKVKVWSTSQKLLDSITMFAGAYPQMFNIENGMDLMINASGEKMQRKYVINPIPTPCPLGVDLTQNPLNDLDQVLADGYVNTSQAIELIVATFPQMIQILGLNGVGTPNI